MTRRRSLVEVWLADWRRARIARKKAAARNAAAEEKAQARERLRLQRENERAARLQDAQRTRVEQAQAKAALQRAREAERKAAIDLKSRERAKLQAEREGAEAQRQHARNERARARAHSDAARAELERQVGQRNGDLERRRSDLDGLLIHRTRPRIQTLLSAEQRFNAEGPDALGAAVEEALHESVYPEGVPKAVRVVYRPEGRELLIERELPGVGVITPEARYQVVRGEERTTLLKENEVRHAYGRVLATATLRTAAEAFAATPPTLVSSLVLTGRVTAVDRATGRTITPILVSVRLERDDFEELRLDAPELDPELCLRAHNALISPHPHDLVPVKPLLYYDVSRFKTIKEADLTVDLDSRLDLLSLSPTEFENLIRQLFESLGLKSWQTRPSRDGGVDAVVVNEDPVLGGLVIVQAKRYSKVVGYEAVTALAGVMNDKAASKGILVTTSWVGKDTRDFAERNGRIQIIDGRELKHMLKESMNMDVLISLPKVPVGWERGEIA